MFHLYFELCFCFIQAETSEDLFEWKAALEEALAQAPNAALVMGHNGIFRNDTCDAYETTAPNCWSHCAAAYISRALDPFSSSIIPCPIVCRAREKASQVTSCWQANSACARRYRWQPFFSRKSSALS